MAAPNKLIIGTALLTAVLTGKGAPVFACLCLYYIYIGCFAVWLICTRGNAAF